MAGRSLRESRPRGEAAPVSRARSPSRPVLSQNAGMARSGPVADTVERLFTILRIIPREPRRIDAAGIERRLRDEGIRVSRRSVQRDLERIAARMTALQAVAEGRRLWWSWMKDAPMVEVPGMGLAAAVTLEMVRRHLLASLPRSTVKSLRPWFDRSQEVLAEQAGKAMARWPKKVRVVPRGLPLRPPDVDEAVLDAVSAALLEERRLILSYKPRGAARAKDYELHPLALVVRDGVVTLLATARDYDDVLRFVLHRATSASVSPLASRRLPGFDLDAFLADGGAGFPFGGRPVRLVADVDRETARTLLETALSDDQRLVEREDGTFRLTATVPDTLELRAWIRSYGPSMEVISPAALRAEVARDARALAKRYGGRG